MHFLRFALRLTVLAALSLVIFSVVTESTKAFGVVPSDEHSEKVAVDGEASDADDSDPGLLGNLTTLGLLVLLQAVLGFDNLLYISLESKHAPAEKRQSVRAWGIGIAIFLRIALLCFLVFLKEWFEQTSVCNFDWGKIASGNFNLHSVIVLAGGAFIIYTAMKEIWHMTRLEHDDHDGGEGKKKTMGSVIFWIVVMNLVFSFDSILSAMALSDVFWVMAAAIVISGLMMIWLSEHVANFLEKNRMYEVLGLFVLFVVGIMLVSEGGHLAHLNLFGNAVEPMTKTTFYFVLVVLVLTDIVQSRYQRKLLADNDKAHA
ncbi:MAG: putative tellurium resistance membrane protein TerC [Mariniblastus sp.]|jgi:predicted tellurium resistance membrane protein TerC